MPRMTTSWLAGCGPRTRNLRSYSFSSMNSVKVGRQSSRMETSRVTPVTQRMMGDFKMEPNRCNMAWVLDPPQK